MFLYEKLRPFIRPAAWALLFSTSSALFAQSPTPTASATPAKTPLTISAATPTNLSGYEETTDKDAIDLKHLVTHQVAVSIHTVAMHENYWTIARDSNIDIHTLIGANPEMPYQAYIDQKLNILSKPGVLHTVWPGETLATISDLYKVEVKTLKQANDGLHWWRGLKVGDVLFVPDARPVRMTAPWIKYFSQRGFFGAPFKDWGRGWSSGFGWRNDPITGERREHFGVDFRQKYGTSVYAAASGRVIFAGVAGGYGNLIRIKHTEGYISMYGHLSKILVHDGQKVHRGQLIGKVGATGRVTGPHLHFEIHKNGRPVNPLPLI